MGSVRILGIDPGSRQVGYGIIEILAKQTTVICHGTLMISPLWAGKEDPMDRRLLEIHKQLSEVIETFKPSILAIEKVFMAKNAVSALKLGQARGVAILSAKLFDLEIFEYNPTEVKRAITGHGRAEKEQVAKMLEVILGPQKFATLDASDGLALALCHAKHAMNGHARALGSVKNKSGSSIAHAVRHRLHFKE